MQDDQRRYLAECFYDEGEIDKGIQAGITPQCFTDPCYRNLWVYICDLRSRGKPTDQASVYAAASNDGKLPGFGGTETFMAATDVGTGIPGVNASALRSLLVTTHSKREAWRLAQRIADGLKGGTASLEDVRGMADGITAVCAGHREDHLSVSDIARTAIAEAEALIAGQVDKEPGLTTGLATFDKYATPIRPHELVIIGGRSSHGKSSLGLQIAMHNLVKGKRVAIFVIETSAKQVLKQMAGQMASINLRNIADATREQQQDYLKWLRWLEANRDLVVFDRDLTMEAIESRGRLIAQSFKPDLTLIDQLNNISGGQGSMYERLSAHSKRCIPFTKMMGNAVIVLAQLGQATEKEGRRPERTDFRDSSQLLEDANRVIFTWRKPGQLVDATFYDHEIMQLKLRDGPLCTTDVKFHSPTTRFIETFNPNA